MLTIFHFKTQQTKLLHVTQIHKKLSKIAMSSQLSAPHISAE